MSRYAVIDVETTGFSPAHNHRILEIAVVLVDDDGNRAYEWDTLVNPQRDVGASDVHGLTAADVYRAPTFADIAGELEYLLQNRVAVAHNLAFDAPFVVAEYERAGYSIPLSPTLGLCTMRLASHYLPGGPRSLEACCGCIGCSIESAHAALEDARATATLLSHYIHCEDDFLHYWSSVVCRAQACEWPAIPQGQPRRLPRAFAAAASREHFLGRLASRAPRCELHPEANSYLALLDRVLLDRQVSRHEEDELVSAAEMMGVSREDAVRLHQVYLISLGRIALEDGVVTPHERADLLQVADLLGLSPDHVDAALEADAPDTGDVCCVGGFCLGPNDAVVFTGDAPGAERTDLEYQAKSLGLRVTGSVSRKTALVVAADPDSISGKARKARELGIPIVDYSAYFEILQTLAR